MFDIGFTELIIVTIVTLLVVGPERLPETIKTATVWLSRARAMLSDAKETIKTEIGIDEIQQNLHNDKVLGELKQAQQKLNQSLNSARSFETDTLNQLEQSVSAPRTETLTPETQAQAPSTQVPSTQALPKKAPAAETSADDSNSKKMASDSDH